MRALEAITTRRSLRRFGSRPVAPALVRELVAAACAAPAPHHSRPWRFVQVTPPARPRLIEAMAAAWRIDLESETRPPADADKLIARSRRQLTEAPLLLLACLTADRARDWPDERRRAAERDMYVQSLGAALQNLLLAAHARGLGGYLKGAPLFCRDAVTGALDLPSGWQPAFFALLGYPRDDAPLPPRPAASTDEFLIER